MRTLALLLAIAVVPAARAHFHMLIPSKHSIKTDESVTLTYQFGHPFECEMFDAQRPERARVFTPDGKETDLRSKLDKIEVPDKDGKKVAAFRLNFTPRERGDHTFIFESSPVWMNDEKHFLRDIVRVVIHVQTQNGWDARHVPLQDFAIVPMTRPYGLRPGTIFQARAMSSDLVGGHRVEVEHYNPLPPKELPADELITLALKADDRGVATCTLPDPGWWVICATRNYGPASEPPMKDHDRKSYPIIERAILWVFVDDVKAK